jgi:hypothetical protein
MMAYEQRDNSGAVFKNEDKSTDAHPDRKGDAKINGVDYWVSGWLKRTKNGDPFLSLSFTPKKAKTDDNAYRRAKDEPPF